MATGLFKTRKAELDELLHISDADLADLSQQQRDLWQIQRTFALSALTQAQAAEESTKQQLKEAREKLLAAVPSDILAATRKKRRGEHGEVHVAEEPHSPQRIAERARKEAAEVQRATQRAAAA